MQHNSTIFETVFNRSFSDTGNADFLKELTEKHPYFSPAHFFLLHAVQDDPAAFEKQALKTTLFFHNPYWLNFQLNQTSAIIDEPVIAPAPDTLHQPETTMADDHPDNTELSVTGNNAQEKEMEPIHVKLNLPAQNVNLDPDAMLFEPMHMVDYFASQGIKLSEEVQTADKLGKQLKSFTEWLKTMKKIPVENDAGNTANPDTNVQILAENSNTGTEVLTEAMAEVYASQGKIAKAIEIYQKLSLLNPAKSTYFAAKSENLKA
jgi:hypothetical protein